MCAPLVENAGVEAEIVVERKPKTVLTLAQIVEDVIKVGSAEHVSVRDVIYAIGGAGFPPILLLPALAVATPLSGIPLLTSFVGFVIALVSWQMLLGRESLWMPRWLLNRQMRGAIVVKGFAVLRRPAAWLDDKTGKRLVLLARPPLVFIPQLVCLCCGVVMPLLEFIPFSSTMVGISVAFLALGMLARDGMFVLLGLMPVGLAIGALLKAFL